MKPKQSDKFRENAQNCADKAEPKTSPVINASNAWRPLGLR
jgi:hypothetical protein